MNLLEKKFLEQIRIRQLVSKDDHVLLAVSGGSDSMALLHLFCAIRKAVPCRISAVHCNFRLRAAESDLDERFVQESCHVLGVPCYTVGFDTLRIAGEWKTSIEETARILRYEYFDSLLCEQAMQVVATGHHVNDNAETMLFNLFRGTSLLGLKGIRAKRGKIIRPLLLVHKAEILGYIEEKHIAFRNDSTNFGIDPDRNFIRNRIIPLIEERFSHKLLPSLQRLSEQAGELEEFLELYFENLLADKPGLSAADGMLEVKELGRLSLFEQKEIFKRALREHDVTCDSKTLDRLARLLKTQPGRMVRISAHLVVLWKGGMLHFQREGYSPLQS
ncbi:MAG: tRNA lysidine(34) synthetase TilS [Chlorobiaceae bacterium]|nr:tRNA lysidine(34) synthetase TilS [Chlorobiaceae bacterium]NTW63991.1 tRNA lysidine(34) synthetase TilS [Chlorobiaceae bacterium]